MLRVRTDDRWTIIKIVTVPMEITRRREIEVDKILEKQRDKLQDANVEVEIRKQIISFLEKLKE